MHYYLQGKYTPPEGCGLDTGEVDAFAFIDEDMVLSTCGESTIPVSIFRDFDKKNFIMRTVTTVTGEITQGSTEEEVQRVYKDALEATIYASTPSMTLQTVDL
ncbi:hypothetical protein [Pectobacterium sp. B2J-2]|uniref:hypothetical protein n=1 Tax=Pectobacterium sp. B2J-2 TaxID=3385372 RepID=UPI0038FCDF80